jgi:hypothetical protein
MEPWIQDAVRCWQIWAAIFSDVPGSGFSRTTDLAELATADWRETEQEEDIVLLHC